MPVRLYGFCHTVSYQDHCFCRDCTVAISKISYKVICTTCSGGKWELGIVWRIDVSTPSRGGEMWKNSGDCLYCFTWTRVFHPFQGYSAFFQSLRFKWVTSGIWDLESEGWYIINHIVVVWIWPRSLTTLNLSFITVEAFVPTTWHHCKDQMKSEAYLTVQAVSTRWWLI